MEDPDEIFEHPSAITRAAAEPCVVDISLEAAFKGFYQSPDSPLVRWLAEQGETDPDVVTYGSNALQYTDTGAEIVVFALLDRPSPSGGRVDRYRRDRQGGPAVPPSACP